MNRLPHFDEICSNCYAVMHFESPNKFSGIYTPTLRDINHGWCHDWAMIALQYIREGCEHYVFRSLESGHSFVRYNCKYYDAEAPEGVYDWKNLPIFLGFLPQLRDDLLRDEEIHKLHY